MSAEILDVILDNVNHRAGDTVTGKVILKVEGGSLTSKGISLNLKGDAVVQIVEQVQTTLTRTSGQWHGSLYHSRSKSRTEREYYTRVYTDSETCLALSTFLVGDGQHDLILEEGDYSYPFTFQLPSGLLSVFRRCRARVSYRLELRLQQAGGKEDLLVKKHIGVRADLDLSTIPEASQVGEKTRTKIFALSCLSCFGSFCYKGRNITVRLRTSRQGFLPGERIPFEMEFKNLSGRRIRGLTAELIEVITLRAQGRTSKHTVVLPGGIQRGQPEFSGKEKEDVWKAEVVVPSEGIVFPTKLGGGSKIIDLDYFLKVRIDVKGCCDRKVEVVSQIIIGSRRSIQLPIIESLASAEPLAV
ncbi:unnamed protein product [Orchesella dallaii]|uniref:Arrestin C-terminal-like domain-containing protein n=1 Tax=Orchesella dallaii TaxID=48710 RepID=A0ABP1RCP6_9HEXA